MNRAKWLLVSTSLGLFILLLVVGLGLVSHDGVKAGQIQTTQWIVLVDDFVPQPLMGETLWYYNRMGGDRGQLDGWWDPGCSCSYPGGGYVVWGQSVVTATITQTQGSEAWVGVWTSFNHVITENIPLNFSAIFPEQILPAYQGSVTGLRLNILDGSGQLQVELQDPDLSSIWSETINLSGGPQTLFFDNLPAGDVRNLNWLVKGQTADFVVVERVELEVTMPALTTAERAFLWSYGMLLANWDAASGLTRDRASFPAGDFDNVSASGLQAVAAAQAWQLGIISEESATYIVSQTTTSLLSLPDCNGLWPHFVTAGQITGGTEFSSVDTVIAMLALVEANQALDLQAGADAVVQAWRDIDWQQLIITPTNRISHGYDTNCTAPLIHTWYDFGTESWLANLGYAAVTGEVADMDTTPPTFNGSGFIDELAWLFLPAPYEDRWDIRWQEYREQAVNYQLAYYQDHPCYAPDLFGLSAAEVPDPSMVGKEDIYQPFGIGGEAPPNDGTDLLGHAVVIPHYPGMVSALRPQEAITFWMWLEDNLFTPLNNVESLMIVDEPDCTIIVWNSLKGSWNLGLQTLGWGNYLLRDENPLYQAVWANDFLRHVYLLFVCPNQCVYLPYISKPGTVDPTPTPSPSNSPTPSATATVSPTATASPTPSPTNTPTATTTPTPTFTPSPTNTPAPWLFERGAEFPDDFTVGTMIFRANACGGQVHGQFGTTSVDPYPPQAGYAQYANITMPSMTNLYLWLRYSKDSPASVVIEIYVDDEVTPRASFIPEDQGSWNLFTWTDPIALGSVSAGDHSIKFFTDGQQFGVADLDKFILSDSSGLIPDC